MMRLAHAPRTAALLAILPLLAGCTDLRQALGIERTVPDEFAVIDRQPLVIPPEFELRPPEAGAEGAVAALPSRRAAQTVFGEGAAPMGVAGQSQGEAALTREAGAERADPEILTQLRWESEGRLADPALADKVLAFSGNEIVDPQAETARLRENRAAGKPVNDGRSPTVEVDGEGGDGGGFWDWF